jgi:hypothetical protein
VAASRISQGESPRLPSSIAIPGTDNERRGKLAPGKSQSRFQAGFRNHGSVLCFEIANVRLCRSSSAAIALSICPGATVHANLVHLMFDLAGMRPFIANWPQAGRGLLARIYRRSVGHVIDIKTRRLLEELSRCPAVGAEWRAPMPRDDMPMIPRVRQKQPNTQLLLDDHDGQDTPTSAAEELRLECMFLQMRRPKKSACASSSQTPAVFPCCRIERATRPTRPQIWRESSRVWPEPIGASSYDIAVRSGRCASKSRIQLRKITVKCLSGELISRRFALGAGATLALGPIAAGLALTAAAATASEPPIVFGPLPKPERRDAPLSIGSLVFPQSPATSGYPGNPTFGVCAGK